MLNYKFFEEKQNKNDFHVLTLKIVYCRIRLSLLTLFLISRVVKDLISSFLVPNNYSNLQVFVHNSPTLHCSHPAF